MGRVYLSGLIDDYFPDYQSDCGLVILLNDGLAQKGGEYRFFVEFFRSFLPVL